MERRRLVVLAVTLATAACVASGTDASKLAGRWAPESAELGGAPFPVSNFGGATLSLTKEGYEFAGDQGAISYLPRTEPAQMDIVGHAGPNAGKTIRAIYRLDGDHLTICYQLGQGVRPTEFRTAAGTQLLLIRYRRVS